jgi:hypothetical protein
MGKQRQAATVEESGCGQGRRTLLVQEQDFQILDAREGLALTEVETPYLVEELKARGVEHSPEDLRHALRGAYELAKGELPHGRVMAGVKEEFLRVAYEKEGSMKRAARVLGCGNATIHLACTAMVRREEP